jgi:hypothetical protein
MTDGSPRAVVDAHGLIKTGIAAPRAEAGLDQDRAEMRKRQQATKEARRGNGTDSGE